MLRSKDKQMGDVRLPYVQCPSRLPHHHLSIRQQFRRKKYFLYRQRRGVDTEPFVLHATPTSHGCFQSLVPSFLIQFWPSNNIPFHWWISIHSRTWFLTIVAMKRSINVCTKNGCTTIYCLFTCVVLQFTLLSNQVSKTIILSFPL